MSSAPIAASILGWAWRTPLGATVDGALDRLLAGDRAAEPFDAGYPVTFVARIPGEPARSRHSRYLRRMGLFGVEVAHEAAGALGGGDRVGLFVGVGGLRAHWNDMMAALAGQLDGAEDAWARGLGLIHPHWLLRHLSNNAHALLSKDLEARGEGATFGGGNAGAQALASACRALADGAIDTAVVLAYDTLLEPETLVERAARGAAADGALTEPYAADAQGPVPAEAAAALVLGPPGGALGLSAADGASGELGEPGEDVIAAVAGRLAAHVTVVDGAARARPALDASERRAIAQIAPGAELTAFARGFGSTGAAAPLLQAIALGRWLSRGAPHRAALGISTGAPGLVGAVRVERG